jgi:hypothetical protein
MRAVQTALRIFLTPLAAVWLVFFFVAWMCTVFPILHLSDPDGEGSTDWRDKVGDIYDAANAPMHELWGVGRPI